MSVNQGIMGRVFLPKKDIVVFMKLPAMELWPEIQMDE
jgi:hypothetical protein